MNIAKSILETIGNTPLVDLSSLLPAGCTAQLVAKVESFNPGGSAKDRVGIAMIEAAEKAGTLAPGGMIIEPTSGNTGVGLAIAAAVKGYRLILTMPDTMSVERQRLLAAFGAELVLTPGNEGIPGAIAKAQELHAANPGSLIMQQFNNPANPEAHRRTTALETMNVYAPLAHRLGIQRIRQELENLALGYLDPIGYAEVNEDIEQKYGQNRDFLESVRKYISEKLEEYNIRFTLEGRVKTVYSIYRKMFYQNKSFDEVYDFYALRIIVDNELECYTALGVIHELFKSVPGRFKDYISTPKPNMYQSLHTTVIGRAGVPFEVQIRTWEMHHIAEYGVAAHWKYKSGEQSKEEIDRKLSWIAKLIDTEDDAEDPDEFMHALKIDLFHDETFVFTPKGDVVSLPQGSTLIDFAYSIHSGVGNKMVGAKINGMIAPIDRIPETGDIVEILTSATSKGPSRDWLKIVRTSEARSKIRQWFKKEKRSENIQVGRAEVMKEITRYGHQLTDTEKAEIALNVARRIGMQELEDMYNTIGYGGMALSKIAAKLRDEHDRYVKQIEATRPTVVDASQVKTETRRHAHTGGIIIDGEVGCAVKFAKCCNPLPGDDVIGFVTKGYGVSVHKKDCPNVLNSMKNEENRTRWKHAEWDLDSETNSNKAVFESAIQIVAENHITLLAEITTALAEMKVSLLSIHTQKKSETTILIHLTVGCKNVDHFNSILSRLRVIRNVDTVSRAIG